MAKDSRLYGRFTLDFADSPKIMPLSDAAFRCLVEATLYSRRMLTDGFLSDRYAVARWRQDVLAELCENDPEKPSIYVVDGGYQIHDFAEHQTTTKDLEQRKEAGRKGGLAKAVATAKRQAGDRSSKRLPETETEYLKDTKPEIVPEGFDRFWDAYPKKADKGAARRAWAKAVKVADAALIVSGAEKYRDDPKRNSDYTKNPATWLNAESWANEPALSRKPIANGNWEEI